MNVMDHGQQTALSDQLLHSFRLCVGAAMLVGLISAGAQKTTPSFTASIQAPKATLKSGSAIQVDITLENQTDELLSVEGLRSGLKGSGLIVWNGENKALEPLDKAKDEWDSARSKIATALPPRQKVTEFVNLAKWFDLNEPGQYTIQLRKKDPINGGWIESNKIMITVIPKT